MAVEDEGLVGRSIEVLQIRQLLVELAAGRGGAAWIEGEPGIGKSALVDAASADAAGFGIRVLRAAADELTQPFELRLVADCLRIAPSGADPFRSEIADLLVGRITVVDPVAAASERLLALVDRECAETPLVLVGDDLQWADVASVAVFTRLVRASKQLPLLVIGIARPVPSRSDVAQVRRSVARHPGGLVLDLDPLAERHIIAMAARILHGRPDAALTDVLRHASGNPLYVREVLDVLVAEGAIRSSGGVADLVLAVPDMTLDAAIGRRLGFLPDSVRSVLSAASLLDSEFSLADLSMISARSPDDLATMVAEARTASVLIGADDAMTFRHPLLRQALRGELPRALQIGLHAHAAHAMAEAGRPWDRVARHLVAAPDAMQGWALTWLADQPADVLLARPETAATLLEVAWRNTVSGDPRRGVFAARLSTVLRMLARHEDVVRFGVGALGSAAEPDVVGEIAWNMSRAYQRLARVNEAITLIDDVLAGPDPGAPWRSRLRAVRSSCLHFRGRADESRIVALEAIDEGERDADPISIATAMMTLVFQEPTSQEMLNWLDGALDLVTGDDPESTDVRLWLRLNRTVSLINLDDIETLRAELPEVITAAELTGSSRQVTLKAAAADCYHALGDWDQALLYVEQVIETPGLFPHEQAILRGIGARIALCRDDRAAAVRHLGVFGDPTMTSAPLQMFEQNLTIAAALLAEADGRPDRAVAILAERLSPEYAKSHRAEFLAESIRLALAIGDRALAEAAAELATAATRAAPSTATATTEALCRSMFDDDTATLLATADHLGRIGRLPLAAFTLQEAAVRLAQQGDLPAARTAFNQASAIYENLGSTMDLRHLKARVRPHGIRSGVRSPRRRIHTGWEALTRTEQTVAGLVGQGKSNPEIAAQLFLSRRTVETHVTHIMHKIQARSRLEVAREVARHGAPSSADIPLSSTARGA
jgi:DNA-binding CsgD family transcriptional regulator